MLASAIISHARVALDSDSTEIPDANCLVWIAEAEARIFQALRTSGAFRSSVTVNSQTTSALLVVTTVMEITSIHGPNWELVPIDHVAALRVWPKNALPTSSGRVTGPPTHWSVDGQGNCQLWPSPSAVESMIVKGERVYTPVAVVGDTPDFPVVFHPLIAEYCISKGYVLQQDATMAQLVMSRFEGELDVLQRSYNRTSQAARATLGGGRSVGGPGNYYPPDSRLRFPWE